MNQGTQMASGDNLTERLEQAEAALRERKLDLQLIVDSIPAQVAIIAPTGEVEILNQLCLDYFGKTLEELKGWYFSDPVHSEDLPHVIELLSRALESGETYEVESRHRRFDGLYRWFHVRGFPLKDTAGTILRWCVLLTDIDERRRAEAQLGGEKRLLEMIASGRSLTDVLTALCRFVEETVPCYCGVYEIDWSGPIFTNAVAPSLPASYVDLVEGWPVHCDVAPCGIAANERAPVVVEDISTDPHWAGTAYEKHVLAHGLRSVWSTPIYSRERQVLGTFCVYQTVPGVPSQFQLDLIAQVTHIASIAFERVRSEEALKRSAVFLAQAQQLSRTGSFSWRVATDEITWSEELYRIYELHPGLPVTFELIRSRVHPEDLTLYEKMVEQARNGFDDFEWQYRLLMPDQSIKYMHAVAQATRDSGGELEYIAAVRDVTARRLSDQALDKARSELAHVARVISLGALTASIAHEVNQPLSGIITNASTCMRMLDAEPPNVDGARETAKRTIRDGRRAADVITRLRALFSKKGAATELIDLNEATREVIALSRSELERNRVVWKLEFKDQLPTVTGDRVQLQQVILNLLRNGSDAMRGVDDRPRELLFRTEVEEGPQVRLSVQDTGVGFEPQTLDRLFQTFYTTKEDGMGIGLSVSRSIIENHSGRMWATPNAGPGVTFSFSIPCVVDGEGT
jgi:PAS domain S-box-containing protein